MAGGLSPCVLNLFRPPGCQRGSRMLDVPGLLPSQSGCAAPSQHLHPGCPLEGAKEADGDRVSKQDCKKDYQLQEHEDLPPSSGVGNIVFKFRAHESSSEVMFISGETREL